MAGGTAANTASASKIATSAIAVRLDSVAMAGAPNGNRKPPRPRIELLTKAGSDSEAAAIVAALEQFLPDTTPMGESRPAQSPGRRAALEGGVPARQVSGSAWGHAP